MNCCVSNVPGDVAEGLDVLAVTFAALIDSYAEPGKQVDARAHYATILKSSTR